MEALNLQVKFNHQNFMKFYRPKLKRFRSERQMAANLGLSHTELQLLRKNKTNTGKPKRFVNLETAEAIECAWGIPENVIFLREAVERRSTGS